MKFSICALWVLLLCLLFADSLPAQTVAKWQQYYEAGERASESGDWTRAVDAYHKAINLNPNSVDAYLGIAHAYNNLDRYKEAAAAAQMATRKSPNNLLAYYNLGAADYKLEKMAGAQAAFDQAYRLDPKSAEANIGVGLMHLRANRVQDAIKSFKFALELEPDSVVSHLGLGMAYVAIKDRRDAKIELDTLQSLAPAATPQLATAVANLPMLSNEDTSAPTGNGTTGLSGIKLPVGLSFFLGALPFLILIGLFLYSRNRVTPEPIKNAQIEIRDPNSLLDNPIVTVAYPRRLSVGQDILPAISPSASGTLTYPDGRASLTQRSRLNRYYEILHVTPETDMEALRAAYEYEVKQRRLDLSLCYSASASVKLHAKRRLQECEEAYQVLLNATNTVSTPMTAISVYAEQQAGPSAETRPGALTVIETPAGRRWDDENDAILPRSMDNGTHDRGPRQPYSPIQATKAKRDDTPHWGQRISLFASCLLLIGTLCVVFAGTLRDYHINLSPEKPWNRLAPVEAGFAALLPAGVQEKTVSTPASDGKVLQRSYTAQLDTEEYAIVTSVYPQPSDIPDVSETMHTIADNLQVETPIPGASEHAVKCGAYSGQEIRFQIPAKQVTVILRIFVIGNRSYVLSYSTSNSRATQDNADKFFDSFSII